MDKIPHTQCFNIAKCVCRVRCTRKRNQTSAFMHLLSDLGAEQRCTEISGLRLTVKSWILDPDIFKTTSAIHQHHLWAETQSCLIFTPSFPNKHPKRIIICVSKIVCCSSSAYNNQDLMSWDYGLLSLISDLLYLTCISNAANKALEDERAFVCKLAIKIILMYTMTSQYLCY